MTLSADKAIAVSKIKKENGKMKIYSVMDPEFKAYGQVVTGLDDTVAELLPIIDNLERAAAFSADSSVKDGLVMIFKSVEAVFSKLGVEAFGNKGDKFDPNLHNAVMHEENAEFGEGEISEVFQKGYKKGNKIIRFAMVKTAN